MTQTSQQAQRPTSGAKRPETSAWGTFLDRDWSHWCTLTDNPKPGSRKGREARSRRVYTETALRADVARFVRRIEGMVQGAVRFAGAVQGVAHGNPHAHVMLDAHGLDADRIRKAWKAGIADVQEYDARRGARFYSLRFVGADPDSLLLSDTLPPLLHPLPETPDEAQTVEPSTTDADVLSLIRPEPKTGMKPEPSVHGVAAVDRVPTARIPSVEVVDLASWSQFMARIILERAGAA